MANGKLVTTPGAISSRKSIIGSNVYSVVRGGSLMDEGVSYYFSLAEIEAATSGFSKKIGKGSFGPVYYGKMKDGKEVAVKMMADSSSHGTQQFVTEVVIVNKLSLKLLFKTRSNLQYLLTGCFIVKNSS